MTSDLVQFLLARIAEDEAVAQNTGGRHDGIVWNAWGGEDAPETMWYRARWDTARVLAECEAKRRIVEELREPAEYAASTGGGRHIRRTLALLALPYADRPGYREEWKP